MSALEQGELLALQSLTHVHLCNQVCYYLERAADLIKR